MNKYRELSGKTEPQKKEEKSYNTQWKSYESKSNIPGIPEHLKPTF